MLQSVRSFFRKHTLSGCLILAALLILSVVCAVGIGPVFIPFRTVWRVILNRQFGLGEIADIDETLDAGCNAEDTKAFSEARGYLDAKLMKKREMMGTIERANCMTVQSSLNSAGKEPKKESATDQLMEVLGG